MDDRKLGRMLFYLLQLRRLRMQQLTAGYELYPGQLPLLETVRRCPGSTQQDAAKQLRVTPASIALSAKRLSAAGLIEKRVDADNKRRNQLFITEQGAQAAELFRASVDAVDAETFAGLSEPERAALQACFAHMIDNLRMPEDTDALPCWKEGSRC